MKTGKNLNLKLIRNITLALAFMAISIVVALYVPEYAETWTQFFGWVVIGLLVIAWLFPIGKQIIGDPTAARSLPNVLIHISFSYLIITLFILCIFCLLINVKEPPSPERLTQLLTENFGLMSYAEIAYPWMLYTLGVVFVGVMGYQVHYPKMSGALAPLVPVRYLGGFTASIVDFTAFSGFYVCLLLILGLSAVMLAKLIASFFGHSLDFGANITMMGVNFALVYLPFSPIWKSAIEKIQKSKVRFGLTMLLFLVGIGFFVVIMYGILHIFLEVFADYFNPLQAAFPPAEPIDQLAQINFPLFLWSFSMITMTVIAGWWAQYVQGYSVRQGIIILLSPYLFAWLLFQGLTSKGFITSEQIFAVIEWFGTAPQAYIMGILASVLLIGGLWRDNSNFVKGLFWITPNLAGRKLSRWRKIFLNTASFVVYSMMVSLMFSIYFFKTVIVIGAIPFSIALVLIISSFFKYSFLSLYGGEKYGN